MQLQQKYHFTCNKCGAINEGGLITLKIIKSKCNDFEIEKKHYPKYSIMIKQSCNECGAYYKFLQQSDDLIEFINWQQDNRLSKTKQLSLI